MALYDQQPDYEVSRSDGSDFVTEMFCESCRKDNKYSIADGFCINCVEYFCQVCLKFHARFLPHHVQQDKLNMPQEFCLEVCQIHSTEFIKYFCEHCEMFACKDCKHIYHKSCTTLSHVPQLAKHVESSAEFKEFVTKLKINEENLTEITQSFIPSKYSEVKAYCSKAKSAVTAQIDIMMHKLADFKKETETDIETIRLKDSELLDSILAEAKTVRSKCEALRRSVEIMQTAEQRSKLFITMKNARDSMTHFEQSIAEFREKSNISKYEFKPNKHFLSTLQKFEQIGSLENDVKKGMDTRITKSKKHLKEKEHEYISLNKQQSLADLKSATVQELYMEKRETINIAVIGQFGTGKSSLINAILGLNADHPEAAKVGCIKTTTSVTPYSHPKNSNFVIWDFPGVGTKSMSLETYLKEMTKSKFDFFIIVSSKRFTEIDVWLALEIEKLKKFFYFVRTHVHDDFENEMSKLMKKKAPKMVKEEVTIKIKSDCEKNLAEFQSKNNIFLVDSYETNQYDFNKLEDRIIRDASVIDDRKQEAIMSVSAPVNALFEK